MSLRDFHILFIAASIILSIFFGVWAIRWSIAYEAGTYLSYGIGSFLLAFALILYSVKFKQKTHF